MLLARIKALHLGMYLMPIILVHWVRILHQLDHCIMVHISYWSDHSIEVCLDLLGYQSIIPHANLVMELGYQEMLWWNHSPVTHINNDINKELCAYVLSVMIHVLHEDFFAMICQG